MASVDRAMATVNSFLLPAAHPAPASLQLVTRHSVPMIEDPEDQSDD